MLIVGGGPAGAAAAVYAARKGIRTGIAGRALRRPDAWTPWASRTSSRCWRPTARSSRPRWSSTRKRYDVDIMNLQRADASCIPAARRRPDRRAAGQRRRRCKSKTVILSTGARWREVNVPGEKEYRNKGVAYCPHCDGPLFKGKRVAVIGGGNSGVEAAIDLAGIVGHVTLLEFGDAAARRRGAGQQAATACPTSTSTRRRRPPRSPATAARSTA